jgi:Protein of unknown function (DUF2846)
MSKNPGVPPRWLHRCAASLLLLLTGCGQVPPTSSVAIPPIPPGAARIWIYRNDRPQEAEQTPFVRLNGQAAGIVQPNGVLYRDVPPGHYSVSVDSYGAPFRNQFAQVDLGVGKEAFIKVSSMREKVGGLESLRTFFFTQLIPPEVAQAAIAATPFYGGG